MRTVQIHQFDPVIYPRKVWVCFGATKEVLDGILQLMVNLGRKQDMLNLLLQMLHQIFWMIDIEQ